MDEAAEAAENVSTAESAEIPQTRAQELALQATDLPDGLQVHFSPARSSIDARATKMPYLCSKCQNLVKISQNLFPFFFLFLAEKTKSTGKIQLLP